MWNSIQCEQGKWNSQRAEFEIGPTFSGQAGNDFFSKIIPPKSYFGQKKILLPWAFRRIQDGGRDPLRILN